MAREIIERRIHQHDIDAVGGQARGRKNLGAGCNVHHDDLGRDGIRGGVAARQTREIGIDLDQNQLYPADALGDRKAGRADAGAQIDHAIA